MTAETLLDHAKQLHQAGELDQAKKAYLKLLKKQNDNPNLLDLLGMLAYQQNDFTTAQSYFKRAVDLCADSATLYCHLGNSYKALGELDAAMDCYQAALNIDQNNPLACNNLGITHFLSGNAEKAVSCYKQAISHRPDFVDAHYNLANSLIKLGQFEAALNILNDTLILFPKHFGALFQLGRLHMQQQSYQSASEFLTKAEKIEPDHFELQCNLGHCCLKTGDYQAAREHYRNALRFEPNNPELHYNLGVLAETQNHLDHAITHYQNAINLNPDYFAAHHNLGIVFIQKPHIANALSHLNTALALQPDNASLQYKIKSLEQDTSLEKAPSAYIKELFDGYADHYDQHLCEALDYNAPHLLLKISRIKKVGSILDLGCGTGLCGPVFKPHCGHLSGVDLSTQMLVRAHQKECYDKLYEQDLIEYLEQTTRHYDLVIAADVLVYFGKLEQLFSLVHQRLHPSGTFLFNIEPSEQMPYRIAQSGRFNHYDGYIEQLAQETGFEIIEKQSMITRTQNNEPVHGIGYYLRQGKHI